MTHLQHSKTSIPRVTIKHTNYSMLFTLRRALHISKFNSIMAAQLPDIWSTVPPVKKDRAIAAMVAAVWHNTKILRFYPPYISHVVAAMVMALAFHTKDPDRVGDILNIFLFPKLSPSAGSEAALITRMWK